MTVARARRGNVRGLWPGTEARPVALVRPPRRAAERRRYEELMSGLWEEFLPCSPAEYLALEEIVLLELRRMKLQEALMAPFDPEDDAGLKRMGGLCKCETEVTAKLERKWKRLQELQASRGQRRGLALEAALLGPQLEAARERLRAGATAPAQRALLVEVLDMMGSSEEAARLARALLSGEADEHGTPARSGESDDDGGPASAPRVLPGPPWNPWHGVAPEQLAAWNDELIEQERARLLSRLERLDAARGAAACATNVGESEEAQARDVAS